MPPLLTTALIHADGTIRNGIGQIVCQDEFDEKQLFGNMQESIKNSLGFEIDITTLTEIKRSVVQQKFYEIPIADYVPVVVGEGAFSTNLLMYREYSTADDFESGNINAASNNSRLAEVDTAVDSLDIKIINWAKALGYNIIELQQASKSGNWSVVEAKERARYKNWVLGLQKICFLGSDKNANVKGLLNQTGVASNTTLIEKPISEMSADALNTFIGGVLGAYQNNNNGTRYPDKFIIPLSDYNGLGVPMVLGGVPLAISKKQYLENMFKELTMNPNFKILPLIYSQQNNALNSLGLNRYILTVDDADSIQMNIPLDYTTTIQDTTNGFQYQSVAYGQYTGVTLGRPLETLYFDYATASS